MPVGWAITCAGIGRRRVRRALETTVLINAFHVIGFVCVMNIVHGV